MANLTREDERRSRHLSSTLPHPNHGDSPTPAFIQHNNNVETFKSLMPPFMKKLMERLSSKYSKIACSIQNLKFKLKELEETLPGQTLPAGMTYQQKYYDSLATPQYKEIFVKNLLDNKKTLLSQRINENQAIYDSREHELKSYIQSFSLENCGSNYFKDCKIGWGKLLDSYIQIQICSMTAKAKHDQFMKEEKRNKFNSRKEEMAKPKILTLGEFEKLTTQLKTLSINKKKASTSKPPSKNGRGEKTAGKSPSPRKTQDQKKKKPQERGKVKTGTKGNGSTKGTAAKRK